MPVALAPSNVFPTDQDSPLSTESASAFVDPKSVAAAPSPRPYRGVLAPEPAGIVSQPSLIAQLESLGERLEAMRKPAAAAKSAAAPAPATSSPAPTGAQVPWQNVHYDTFAKYAGEASRISNTGRLPFGSDTKKMSL